MRNRELCVFTALLLAVCAASVLLAAVLFGSGAALFCAGVCLVLCALALAFTRWRYRELAKLSRYLVGVYLGDRPVDIRDERPGELSALKDDLYKVTAVLEAQRAALEKDRTFLRDALSGIAHQLKTPLAAISLNAELWTQPETPDDVKAECARNADEQARRLQWLVERLLKLSRLDAKAVAFDGKEQPAHGVIRRACVSFIAAMGQKQIDFSIDCPETLSCRCDAAWTAEALANVVKNAVEHTPEGGMICISAGMDPLWYTFRVQNTGAPIPGDELPHIFERFYKGQNAAPGSVGIGLALARAIARGQGGELTAENAADGVRFTLRLPR